MYAILCAVFIFYLDKSYSGYLPADVLEAGLKTGKYIQGHLNVNRQNAGDEAFVRRKRLEAFYALIFLDRNFIISERSDKKIVFVVLVTS